MNMIIEGYGYYLSEEDGIYKVWYIDENNEYKFSHNLDMNGHDTWQEAWEDFIGAFK